MNIAKDFGDYISDYSNDLKKSKIRLFLEKHLNVFLKCYNPIHNRVKHLYTYILNTIILSLVMLFCFLSLGINTDDQTTKNSMIITIGCLSIFLFLVNVASILIFFTKFKNIISYSDKNNNDSDNNNINNDIVQLMNVDSNGKEIDFNYNLEIDNIN